MRVCICDDDNHIHTEIRDFLQNYKEQQITIDITDYFSGEEITEYYRQGKYFDIVFLDVEMDKCSGTTAAEIIQSLVPETIIIFVSSFPKYVFNAFKLEAFHFIIKPINLVELEDVFQRAIKRFNDIHKSIVVKWQDIVHRIPVKDIMYIEGYRRTVFFNTINHQKYKSLGKITDIINIVEPNGFVQVHQGYIVNMDYIKSFEDKEIILCDGTPVMVSARKKAHALKTYSTYIRKWKW